MLPGLLPGPPRIIRCSLQHPQQVSGTRIADLLGTGEQGLMDLETGIYLPFCDTTSFVTVAQGYPLPYSRLIAPVVVSRERDDSERNQGTTLQRITGKQAQ